MSPSSNEPNNAHEPWTLANTITVVRIALIPVFIVLMLAPWTSSHDLRAWVSLFVFVLVSLTDSLDGYLARSRNQITVFGKFMDPIADKLLVAAALIVLIEYCSLPSWIPIVIIAREFLVSGLRMLVASRGVVIAASWTGKVKTAVTLVAIGFFIVKDAVPFSYLQPFMDVVSWILMICAVILTFWSMIDYFVKSSGVLFGSSTPSNPVEPVHPLATEVVEEAVRLGVTLSTAESCTGGLVAAAITSVPGSSEALRASTVSYATEIKSSLLGVDETLIQTYGVVSVQVAQAMAEGACLRHQSDYAVSTTGVAGPGGGDAANPVGTVCFAVAGPNGVKTSRIVFDGDRPNVRAQAVDYALNLLLDFMRES